MLKILVDSTADLPETLIKKYKIDMIPLSVHIEQEDYLDKKSIKVEDVYQALKDGKDVKTSQPNPGEIMRILENSIEDGVDLVVITISSKLSGTYQVINMIAGQVMEQHKNSTIHVIDSKGGSAAAGLMAIQAALLIEKNYSKLDIIEVMKDLANHCQHIFSIADLKHLIKNGRLTKTEALIGNMLKVKPLLTVLDGEIKVVKKVRGNKKILKEIIDRIQEKRKQFPNQIIAICHADNIKVAEQLEILIKEQFKDVNVFVDTIGSVLATHLGIGGIGVFFFDKKPKHYINQLDL